MNKKQFRDICVEDVVEKDQDSRTITFIASTEKLNRHGHIVRQNWSLKEYNKNNVVFYNHFSDQLPIGTSKTWVDKENNRLMTKITFAQPDENPQADFVYKLCSAGILKAVSPGYLTDMDAVEVKEDRKTKQKCLVLNGPHELLEMSVAGIPSNSEAVMQNAIKDGIIDELELKDFIMSYKEELQTEEPVEDSNKEIVENQVEKIEQTIKDEDLPDPFQWFFDALDSAKADLNKPEELDSVIDQVVQSLRGNSNEDSKQTTDQLDEILSKFAN
jgi:HK97 family phage prohead protease